MTDRSRRRLSFVCVRTAAANCRGAAWNCTPRGAWHSHSEGWLIGWVAAQGIRVDYRRGVIIGATRGDDGFGGEVTIGCGAADASHEVLAESA